MFTFEKVKKDKVAMKQSVPKLSDGSQTGFGYPGVDIQCY